MGIEESESIMKTDYFWIFIRFSLIICSKRIKKLLIINHLIKKRIKGMKTHCHSWCSIRNYHHSTYVAFETLKYFMINVMHYDYPIINFCQVIK